MAGIHGGNCGFAMRNGAQLAGLHLSTAGRKPGSIPPRNWLLISLPFEDMFMIKFVATTTASLAVLLTALFTTTAAQTQDAAKLAQEKACMACHQTDRKVVGPSYKEVAARYAGQKDAEAKLAKKVREGGSGVWGQVPMPPNTTVTEKDALVLVKWILSQK
jgi:cytochrome c